MKKVLSVIICFAIILNLFSQLPISVNADKNNDLTENLSGTTGSFSWTLDTDGKLTIEGTGEMPDNINTSWHENRKYIKTVEIKSGITSIGNSAFYACGSLTSVTIPESVTHIDQYAFYANEGLTFVLFAGSEANKPSIDYANDYLSSATWYYNYNSNDEATYTIQGKMGPKITWGLNVKDLSLTISGSSDMINYSGVSSVPWYNYRYAIKNVIINKGVTSIGTYVFCDCSNLTSIIIPEGVTSIGNSAFEYCSSLKSVIIPEGVTNIGNSAFYYCSSLTSVSIPKGVTAIRYYTFYGCSSLKSVIIPEGVTYISNDAFHDCSSLISVTIPESVTEIGSNAFSYCSSLASVTIPNGIKCISGYVFRNCKKLSTVSLPLSIEGIYDYAFEACESLENVYYAGSEEDRENILISQGNEYLTFVDWTYKYHDENNHVYDDCCDTTCNICGYVREPMHSFYYYYSYNSISHWYECSTCHEKKKVEAHVYSNNKDETCNICGYTRYIPGSDDTNTVKLITESKEVLAGTQFTVTVKLENNPGFAYLELTPIYPDIFTLTDVKNGNIINDFEKGIQYIWINDNDVTSTGTLLTLTFTTDKATKIGKYGIDFIVRSCVNYSENMIYTYVEEGTIELIDFIYGDVNGDGAINGQDVIRLKKYLANYNYITGTSAFEIESGADVNGDGIINGQDVIRLKKYLANYDYDTETSTIKLGPN